MKLQAPVFLHLTYIFLKISRYSALKLKKKKKKKSSPFRRKNFQMSLIICIADLLIRAQGTSFFFLFDSVSLVQQYRMVMISLKNWFPDCCDFSISPFALIYQIRFLAIFHMSIPTILNMLL